MLLALHVILQEAAGVVLTYATLTVAGRAAHDPAYSSDAKITRDEYTSRETEETGSLTLTEVTLKRLFCCVQGLYWLTSRIRLTTPFRHAITRRLPQLSFRVPRNAAKVTA